MGTETRVRGIAFRNLVEAAETLYGAPVGRELRANGVGAAFEALRAHTLDTSGFFPVRELADNEARLAAMVGGDVEVAFAVGHHGLTDHLPRVFALFLRVLSPGFVLDRSTTIVRRYFDRGYLGIPKRGPHHATIVARDLPGFDPYLWSDFRGSMTATLEVAGAREVAIDLVDGGIDDHATFDARWR